MAGEIYISPGMFSYHFNRGAGYNGENLGINFQLDQSRHFSLSGGRFKNSEHKKSFYAAGIWYPFVHGSYRIGLLAGGFDGYPKERDGGWFLAGMPVLNVKHRKWCINVAAVPTYKNRIHGAIIFQFMLAVN